MAYDHEYRYVDPRTGTLLRIPLDSTNPEHAALIERRAREGGQDVFRLDAQGASELARTQYVQRTQERYEREGIAGSQPLLQTAGAALGIADELTLGLDRRIARALGLTQDQEDHVTAIQQAGDEGYLAGRLGAAIAPALLTGGESLAARGTVGSVAARFAPAGFANALGNTVAGAVESGLLARGLGPGLARTAGRTLGTVADGTVSGMAAAITDANVRDEELTGEQLLAGAGLGFTLGVPFGVLGGGLEGGLVALQSRAAREGAEALQRAGLARVVDDANPPRIGDLGELREPERPGFVAWLLGRNPAFADPTARRDLMRVAAPGAFERANNPRGFSEFLTATARTFDDAYARVAEAAAPVVRADARQAAFRAAAEGADDASRAAARDAALEVAGRVRAETAGATDLPRAARDRLLGAARDLERAATEGDAAGDTVARLDRYLDDLRRTGDAVGDARLDALRGAAEAAGDRLAPGFSSVRRARDEYEAILRDMRRFGNPSETEGFRFSPQQLRAQFGSAVHATRGDNLQMFQSWLERSEAALRLAEGHGGDAARVGEALDALRESTRLANEALDWGDLVGSLENVRRIESGTSGAQAAVGNKIGFLAAGAAGWAAGGPLVAALGIGLAAFGHPTGFLAGLSGLRRMSGLANERLAESGGRLARALRSPRLERGLGGAAVGARQVPRVVLGLRSARERHERYDELVEGLRSYAADPSLLASRLERLTEHIAGPFPNASAGFAGGAVRAVYHLVENLPPASRPSPFPGKKRRPSVSEMEDFIRRYEALEDPFSLLDRAADGSLQRAHVDAVRAVYPRLYAALAAETTAILGDLETLPPYQMRVRIGTLLGVPADATLDPRFVFAAQQTYAQTAEQNAAQLGRGPTATMSMRVSDDTLSRAASVTHRL